MGRLILVRASNHVLRPLLRWPLPSDDLVLDLVVDVRWNDLALGEVIVAVIWPIGDYRLDTRGPDARQLMEFLGRGRVYIHQFALCLRLGGRGRFRGLAHAGGGRRW